MQALQTHSSSNTTARLINDAAMAATDPAHGQYLPLDVLLGRADGPLHALNLGHQLNDSLVLRLELLHHGEVGGGFLTRLGRRGVDEGDHLLLRVELSLNLSIRNHLE